MIATIVIASITFIAVTLSILFFPKMRIGKVSLSTYWLIALTGAIILLCSSLAPIKEVWNQLIDNKSINPLKILVLFFSMTFISIFLDEVGLFKYLANVASKKAKNNQFALFTILYFLTAVLTIFTSNDIVILTFTPFICFFCKNSKVNPIPYLVSEFAAANTWSLMLIIGNPTNIYLATSKGVNFFEYFKVMAIPTLVMGITEYLLLLLIFFKKLKAPLEISEEDIKISNKPALIVGLTHLFICLIFLVIANYIDVEMWLISLISASSLLIYILISSLFKIDERAYLKGTAKKLPYPLIPFFLSMFIIVVALNYQGVTSKIGEYLSNPQQIWTYGYTSFAVCNLINNIPMSILFSNICYSSEATYASIIGSNIGAFLTPIGALAGIMFTNLISEHNTKYTFIDFVKYGVIIALPVITIGLGMLHVIPL